MIKSSPRPMAWLTLALSTAAAALLATAAPALAETCPNEQFRTGPSANLPDCRAYELVTPPFKEAAEASLVSSFEVKGFAGMSADGSHVAVTSIGNFGDAQDSVFSNSYELTRTESGWSEANIDLPASQFPASAPLQATPDYGAFLYEARATDQSFKAKDLWIREADGALRDLGPFLPPSSTTGPPGTGAGEITENGGRFNGASADLSHVVFETSGTGGEGTVPWPGDGSGSLYEYIVGQGGPPVLVSLDPSGNPCEADPYGSREIYRGMSADGSTVFFEPEPGSCLSNGPPVSELFARVDGSRTVAISEPSAADCSACDTNPAALAEPTYDGASADGLKVFFTTAQPLLGGDTSANIYEYDFDAPGASPGDADGRIVQVSGGDWSAGGAQVQGVVKISEDGSHVYFVAQGALSEATNNQGQTPTAGGENLYVFERDAHFSSGRLSFVATLSPSDLEVLERGCRGIPTAKACGATVTPDGRFLVFTSSADLAPGDTSSARQVFEYDAHTGDLVRVSIGQNGFNDDGNTDTFDASIPQQKPNYPLAMSNDGAYVVFESAEGLTPQALNGYAGEVEYETIEGEKAIQTYYAHNVYEYHNGEVYLVSDGQDTSEEERIEGGGLESSVKLRGMSPSGDDIFFETADRLVPQDLDTETDLYDARIDGGFPAPVSLLPSCSGDACQGQLSPSPVLLLPGSEFQAGGNPPLVAAMPVTKTKPKARATTKKGCKKGLEERHGKCVGKKKPKRAAKSARGRR